MDARQVGSLLVVGVGLLFLVVFLAQLLFQPALGTGHDHATVTITDERGTELAVVDATVADTPVERFVGLATTDALDEDEGMLFVFEDEAERTFVMRGMDFPIDIVFVGADGQIRTIHGAHPDENSLDRTRYRGEARWVIEVNIGYAAERGIEPGHRVEIAYE